MRRVLVLAALLLIAPAPAAAQDSLAPRGAEPHWLPDEEWVNYLWLPFDEHRLYAVLGRTRGDVFRWVRVDATNSLAQLARRRGLGARTAARRIVANRRGRVSPRMLKILRSRTERVLTQPHLAQHLLFHALHQNAISDGATRIFGVRSRQQFYVLRRAELSPLQIGELFGRTRTEMRQGCERALRAAAARGVRTGALTPRQRKLMLDRQLRQLPRWLGQRRYNGPTGGRNRPRLPAGDQAKHPTLTADGSRAVWDAYRSSIAEAERLGEIHVRARDLGATGARAHGVSPPVNPRSRKPYSAYNAVVAADGGAVAFETAQSTYPLAKRVGQMSVLVRDLRTGEVTKVSHAARPAGAPTRTAFNPSISADGRLVAFEATDAGARGAPSRNGLFVFDRATGSERLLADHGGEGAAFLPDLAAGGSAVAFAQATGEDGRTLVYRLALADGTRELVSRADGDGGAAADRDAYEPEISADGSVVAFTTRAGNLGAGGRTSRVWVRDLRARTTKLVSGAVRGDASEPAISADGRWVAFVERVGRVGSTPASLRSRIWLFDRQTARTIRVAGRADGYNSEPFVSADGSRVAFTSTTGTLSAAKARGLAGVFVCDIASGRVRLLSEHASRRGADQTPSGHDH